ncbi:MAG: biosynthetic-type acetolactate synthase large subunit [Succinivibrionaceae bacterium]|nr:biosynthetic-type acetolactate synthase large subunit [Succinivibrionaceae bacterium]
MENPTGAQMVVRTLEDLGVERIFGYPGAAIIDIYDELMNSQRISHVLARHEQGAVHMADGYARATGKVGCALVTSGPGATNTVTAIATAYGDSIPLVLITGQVSTGLIGTDAFQEVDTMGVTRPVVKHSFLCKKPEEVPKFLRQAFYIASTGRKGPVVVDIPKNCQTPRMPEGFVEQKDVSLRSYNPTVLGHKGQIKRAMTTLATARRPVLIYGGGVIQGEACAELRELVERFNLPVVTTLMGISGFPSSDRHFLGMVGMHGIYAANEALHNCDALFAVAVRFDDRVTNNVKKFCPNATVIHIDVDPASISKCVHADIPVVGDAKAVLGQCLGACDELHLAGSELTEWWGMLDGFRKAHPLSYPHPQGLIMPQDVVRAVSERLQGQDYYVTTDVGQHQMFVAQYFGFERPRTFITSGGLGTMGFGFPAAAGAKMAHPKAQVICFTGDGSFQMNMQELSTCKQYHLPVKIFILDNHVLGMVRQWQSLFYDQRYAATCLDFNPDFVRLAEAFGHQGIAVSDPAELDSAVERALAMEDELVIVDVRVNPDAKVFPMQRVGGSSEDMILSEEEA